MLKRRKEPQENIQTEMCGSVVAQISERRSRFGRNYYSITLGRWKTNGKKMLVSRFLYASDLDDVIELCMRLQERIPRS